MFERLYSFCYKKAFKNWDILLNFSKQRSIGWTKNVKLQHYIDNPQLFQKMIDEKSVIPHPSLIGISSVWFLISSVFEHIVVRVEDISYYFGPSNHYVFFEKRTINLDLRNPVYLRVWQFSKPYDLTTLWIHKLVAQHKCCSDDTFQFIYSSI